MTENKKPVWCYEHQNEPVKPQNARSHWVFQKIMKSNVTHKPKMEARMTDAKEFVDIPELVRRYALPSENWAYQRSRNNNLPGMRRVGHYVRVNLAEFDAAVKTGVI